MSSPRIPSDFKGLVPSLSGTLCGSFVNTLLKLPLYVYEYIKWSLDNDGNVSNAFKQQIVRPGTLVFSAALINDETDVLLCDGREVSKSDYPELYEAIGDMYGTATTTTNFKVPDYSGKFPVCVGAFDSGKTVAVGQKIGSERVVLTLDEIPAHTHELNGLYSVGLDRNNNNNGVTNNNALSDSAAFTLTTESEGGTGTPPKAEGHDNIPPGVGVFIYVKA